MPTIREVLLQEEIKKVARALRDYVEKTILPEIYAKRNVVMNDKSGIYEPGFIKGYLASSNSIIDFLERECEENKEL